MLTASCILCSMAAVVVAFGVVLGTIFLIIFTEVLEGPILGEAARLKFGPDSDKKLPKSTIKSFHITVGITSYLLGTLAAYFFLFALDF